MDRPRGVRNNNPGNLRKNGTDKWQGLNEKQSDAEFFQFIDAVYGIRALARTLINYQDIHDLHNVKDIITRWAPPGENPTDMYIGAVCRSMRVTQTTLLDLHTFKDLHDLTCAIIEEENGRDTVAFYTEAQITKGLVLAGVEPAKRSLAASRQVIGGVIAAAATTAQPIISQLQTSLVPLTDYSDTIKHVFIAVTLIGIVIGIWAKVDERNKGIS